MQAKPQLPIFKGTSRLFFFSSPLAKYFLIIILNKKSSTCSTELNRIRVVFGQVIQINCHCVGQFNPLKAT